MDNPRMTPCLDLPIDQKLLEEVVEKAKDWALMHGACMRSKTNLNTDILQFAPFVLLPSTFPRKEFEKAVAIQPILNELMHKVAHDYDFLSSSLKSTITVDQFTKKLFEIYETVRSEGIAQPVSLGLVRSDIMLESSCIGRECASDCSTAESGPYCCWKQVEINTIASGFGWLGPASGLIHRYVLQELGRMDMIKNLPENKALQGLCGGMLEAWKIYKNNKAVIMFIVEDVTYNICDQRFHEFELRSQNPNVPVIRRNLTQLSQSAKLGSNKELIVDGLEVAVIYFRAGYEPGHYHTEKEWDARLLMERSLAIKCPSIHYHLAGTKKVQQSLARPGVLEKFLAGDKTSAVKEIFTGLYSLDKDEFGEKAIQMAIENPSHFVLKPQREGGGNNVYGENVRSAVLSMKDTEERSAWILMERILPPLQHNYMVRPGDPKNACPPISEVVGELGIFGVVIGDENIISTNKQVGHMLRTKLSTADEGGVAAGLGALDSPYLVDLSSCCE
ncbi:glutathione synthetase-like isoform X1 [Neocloeon triangulifer]|uniref:glutathione synthetase-like isoform X1 n=1 Tax=Neocloeon triangulifer TaxID=2078957 RepID=UPI00286F6D63|nr:glutathione synthetase-like isoform X1 [Neocloeon triangulifer]